MERQLRARLEACKRALHGKSGPSAKQISDVQAAAVAELVGRDGGVAALNPEIRASLVDIACECAWADDACQTRVLQLLNPLLSLIHI